MNDEIITILQALIDGEDIEFSTVNNWSKSSLGNTLNVLSHWSYGSTSVSLRSKPKTIQIGEFTVPEPLRTSPINTIYYYVDVAYGTTEELRWDATEDEKVWLANGMLQATEEGAEQQLAALLSLTKEKK